MSRESIWEGVLSSDESPMATTEVVDGERLTKEALEEMARKISSDPVMVNVEHIPGVNPIGWIESARVVELPEGEFSLVGRRRLLTRGDFEHPARLRAGVAVDFDPPKTIALTLSYSPSDLDEEAVTDAAREIPPPITVRHGSGARRYSLDPVVIIATTVIVFPFLKRLSEHLADDAYAGMVRAYAVLASRLKRHPKDGQVYYVFDYPKPNGPVQLVAKLHVGQDLHEVLACLDDGLTLGKGILKANRTLKKVCLLWVPEQKRWGFSYAVRRNLGVVTAHALMGAVEGDGIRVSDLKLKASSKPIKQAVKKGNRD